MSAKGAARTDKVLTQPSAITRLLIETTLGDIEVEIDPERAPVTSANFLKYVEGGFYNGGSFHRAVRMDNQPDDKIRIEVVQASASADQLKRKPPFPPIVLERTRDTGLRHVDGTISMARSGPDTATHSFFICVGDQPVLDYGGMRNPDGQGFAAFGRVVRGMEVVRKIHQQETEKQTLTPAIKIIRASVIRTSVKESL
jgi:peptidyl-prolyl cis-trans isomerase A (cyclophilin A)